MERSPAVPHPAVDTRPVAGVLQEELHGGQVVLQAGHVDGRQSQVLIVLVSPGSGSQQETN